MLERAGVGASAVVAAVLLLLLLPCLSWAGLSRAGVGAAAVVAAAMVLLLLCFSWAGLQNSSSSFFLSCPHALSDVFREMRFPFPR